MGTNRKQHYCGEYKQSAVNYVMTSSKSIEEAAKDLKIAKYILSKGAFQVRWGRR
ncbi:hypothetical protein [Anoxynatronum sibiricum]|uniref:Uncharacterized protein n=1 Tax=Anoxynatronum sibiricum TaxID=210623 RepID=A0ABU9VTB0_9CLOT